MNKWAVDWLPICIGCCFALLLNFARALVNPFELPKILAADSSARYSLDLEIASWINIAMIGVRIPKTNNWIKLPESLSLPKPPNRALQRAIIATYEITPAIIPAIVWIKISLFFIWEHYYPKTVDKLEDNLHEIVEEEEN